MASRVAGSVHGPAVSSRLIKEQPLLIDSVDLSFTGYLPNAPLESVLLDSVVILRLVQNSKLIRGCVIHHLKCTT